MLISFNSRYYRGQKYQLMKQHRTWRRYVRRAARARGMSSKTARRYLRGY